MGQNTRSLADPEGGSDAGPAAAWLFETSPDLFLALDAQGAFTSLNPAWIELLGWDPDELVGRSFAEFIHPHDLPTDGQPFRLKQCDGDWRWVRGFLRRAPDGSSAGVFHDCHRELSQSAELDQLGRLHTLLGSSSLIWSWTVEPRTLELSLSGGDPRARRPNLRSLNDLLSIMHPDDAAKTAEVYERALREGGSGVQDSRLRGADGEWVPYRATWRAEPHPAGGFRLRGFSQSLGDLAKARDDALQGAERLSLALKAARAGVCEVDFRIRSTWCSEEFVQIVGQPLQFYGPETVPWPMCHPDDRPTLDAVTEGWQGARHDPVEIRVILPDGGERWIEIVGERSFDEAGELAKITCMVLDIDARKRQELVVLEARREAQSSAERLKLALDAATAGVFETDVKNQRFWCSPEFVQIVGRELTYEEAAGIWPIIHPEDARRVREGIERSENGSAAEDAEWRILTPSGDYRWIEARAIIHHGSDGEVEKLVGVVIDIDARKRQELALIEAERAAQAAAEAKSQFLANMSHEIRTPMNGVMGVLHLLGAESLSQGGRRLLGEAEGCGRMLSQLLDDVIDISRIDSGRLELSPEAVDAAAELQSVAALLQTKAEEKGLKLRVRTYGAQWVMADPVRLRQALFNLIGNAVKFTVRGHVEVRLTSSDVDGRRRLRFEIEDTGVGVPDAVKARLFQRFTQADGSSAREFGGSGLGLAITRGLAELMDGEVGFISREGAGSTFWLEIVAAAAPAPGAEAPAPAAAAAPLGALNILVVEDNPTNRLIACSLLESLGAHVVTANDGLEGLEAVQRQSYDLVLMDIQMPRMDGVEATRRIRALPSPVASVPIVALTANVLAHQQMEYLAAGMNGVAGKPIALPALLGEIARAVSGAPGTDRAA